MLAHNFTRRMLARLVRAGLITIRHEVIKASDKPIEVGKVRITYSGRRALEGDERIALAGRPREMMGT
jgi:16S rRNA U516 pseudouridylate synthase RsuA-like enzyme